MAKAIWREENPDKERLPKDFVKSFDLGLRGIGQGSKVAQLPRRVDENGSLFGDGAFDDIFIEAQERIAAAVIAANNNTTIRPLPENVIFPFEKIGKSILSSEVIDINPLAHGKKRVGIFRVSESAVNLVVRKSRVRNFKKIDSLGFVIGLSEAPSALRISSSFGFFSYPLPWAELRSNGAYSIGSVVSFSINVETDALGEIKRFISPGAISPSLALPLGIELVDRIRGFAELEAGWLDGLGAPQSPSTSMRAMEFAVYLTRFVEGVFVFPESEGGIQFEWKSNDIAASLLINEDTFLLGASDLRSDRFREKFFRGVSDVAPNFYPV